MSRSRLHALALTLSLSAGVAGAQDLGAYQKLAASLDEAARVRPASATQALAQLDRAQAAFTALSPTLNNRQLATGLNNTLSGARAALARTPAELQAQVALARGLMRKALYDQTLSQLASGQANNMQVGILSREFGLDGALTKDAQAGQLERVAWRLQRAAVSKVNAALAATQPRQDAASYLNLARATGWFTVVQDSAGVGTLSVARFGDALQQLTSGETGALRTSLTALRSDMKGLTATLEQAPGTKPVATPPTTGTQPPVTVSPTSSQSPAQAPTQAPIQSPAQPPASSPAGTGGDASSGTTVGGLTGVYAALARALSAASHADMPLVREQMAAARQALGSAPQRVRNVASYGGVVTALDRAAQGRALRPQHVQALIGEVANLEREASGQPLSALDRVSGTASRFGGWVRALLFALLAALCAVPLYLLNLAFGGRNTSWRAVSAGLALLLLPLFLEGLFGLLGALGDTLNVGVLRSLTNLTLFQGAYGLPLWWLLSAGALALLSGGFWGLCQQFGLLGQSRATPAKDDAKLDWDEEF